MTVNIHEAKTHLSKLLSRVSKGEEVVIAKAGKPVARLVPVAQTARKRPFGIDKGKIWMAPDFDVLPEDFLQAFYGGSLPDLQPVPKRSKAPKPKR
jgi:prevent-host-death family protein